MQKSLLAILLTCISCFSYPKVYNLLDQKDDYFWSSQHGGHSYALTILDNTGIWFDGRLAIDDQQTLYLHGFEKGQNHPTHYKTSLQDSLPAGYIFLWARGLNADTVIVENHSGDSTKLPRQMMLFKKKLP